MSVNVCIVEDNALKAACISDFFLREHNEIFSTAVCGSFQSALKSIEKSAPQLIILDMTLPTFDRKPNSREGRMRPIGGYDLMCKMKHKSISSHIIVVTQLETFGEGDEEVSFSEMTARCEREFPDIFLGSVYFDQGGVNWQTNLTVLVQKFLKCWGGS